MPRAAVSMEQVMQIVVFSLGAERYALPIDRVQEVIRHAAPRPVGSRIPFVAGVIELRGGVVPVCDIAARVGARPAPGRQRKIVIVDLPGGRAGVLVDAVDEVVTVPAERLSPVPAVVASPFVRAIARLGDELVMVLEADRLLAGAVESPQPKRKPATRRKPAAAKPRTQPSRKRSEKATRSTGAAATGSPSSVTA